jgi:hypothetical protein
MGETFSRKPPGRKRFGRYGAWFPFALNFWPSRMPLTLEAKHPRPMLGRRPLTSGPIPVRLSSDPRMSYWQIIRLCPM